MSEIFAIHACPPCHDGQDCGGGEEKHWIATVSAESKEDLYQHIFKQTLHILESDGCLQVDGFDYDPAFIYDKEKNVFILDDELWDDAYLRVLTDFLELVLDPPDDRVIRKHQTEWNTHEIKLGGETKYLNLDGLKYLVEERCISFEEIHPISMYI